VKNGGRLCLHTEIGKLCLLAQTGKFPFLAKNRESRRAKVLSVRGGTLRRRLKTINDKILARGGGGESQVGSIFNGGVPRFDIDFSFFQGARKGK